MNIKKTEYLYIGEEEEELSLQLQEVVQRIQILAKRDIKSIWQL